MKKFLYAFLILTIMVSTAYSTRLWRAKFAIINTAQDSNQILASLPEADFVVLIDIGQLLDNKLISSVINDPKHYAEWQKAKTEALNYGIDISQLKQLVIAGKAGTDNIPTKDFQAIVTGRFEREKILAALRSQKISYTSETYNGNKIFTLANNNSLHTSKTEQMTLCFLATDTLLFGTVTGVKNSLDAQAGKQPNLLANQELSSYISNLSTTAVLRMAGIKRESSNTSRNKRMVITNDQFQDDRNNPEATAAAESQPIQEGMAAAGDLAQLFNAVRAGYGAVDISSGGFNLNATMVLPNPEQAKQISEAMRGLLLLGRGLLPNQIKTDLLKTKVLEVIDQINITEAEKDVNLTIDLSPALIDELWQLLKQEEQRQKPARK